MDLWYGPNVLWTFCTGPKVLQGYTHTHTHTHTHTRTHTHTHTPLLEDNGEGSRVPLVDRGRTVLRRSGEACVSISPLVSLSFLVQQ